MWEQVKKAAKTKAWVASKRRGMSDGRDRQKPQNRGETVGNDVRPTKAGGAGVLCLTH